MMGRAGDGLGLSWVVLQMRADQRRREHQLRTSLPWDQDGPLSWAFTGGQTISWSGVPVPPAPVPADEPRQEEAVQPACKRAKVGPLVTKIVRSDVEDDMRKRKTVLMSWLE
eukprot:6394164-Amphidinium_carterae.1